MSCLWNVSKKSLKASKSKNILVILSIILSTSLLTSIAVFSLSIQSFLVQSSIEESGGSYHAAYKAINEKQLNLIKNNEKVGSWGKYIMLGYPLNFPKSKFKFPQISLSHMDDNCLKMSDINLKAGRFPKSYNEVAVEDWVLKLLKINENVGERLPDKFTNYLSSMNPKSSGFILTGIIKNNFYRKTMNSSTILISDDFASYYKNNSILGCLIRIKDGYNINNSLSDILNITKIDEAHEDINSTYIKASGGDPTVVFICVVIAIIVILASSIVIYNIFYISILEKIHEFGLLSALGATKKQIRKLILNEGILLSLIGIPLGVILGYALCLIIIPLMHLSGFKAEFSVYTILIAASVSLFTIILALRKPQKLASKISPIEAMRFGSSQLKSSKVSKKASKKMTILKIAFLNLGRSKKRTVMTILSLSMSGLLFLIITTFIQVIDYRLNSQTAYNYEFSVTPYGDSNIDKSIINKISNLKGVKRIMRIGYSSDCIIMKKNSKIYGEFDCIDNYILNHLDPYIISGLKGSSLNDALLNKNGIIVSVNNHGKSLYHIGQRITLPIRKYNASLTTGYTHEQTFTVSAIVNSRMSDIIGRIGYNPYVFITSDKAFKGLTGYNRTSGIYIIIDRKYFHSLNSSLTKFAAQNALDCTSISDMKKASLRQYAGLKITLFGLVGIIALIGSLNLINTIITSIHSRKKEFGMLQSIGLSDSQLQKMLLEEGLLYSATSIVISTVFGIATGYFLVYKLMDNPDDMAYRFPIMQFLLMVAVVIIIQIAVTALVQNNMKKESIIDRIRLGD